MNKSGAIELGEASSKVSSTPRSAAAINKGISVLDFILRLVALVGTLASAIAMGTTNETLPFFTQFVRFKAEYNDLPTFTFLYSDDARFFVIANSVVSVYLLQSLVLSIYHIVRTVASKSRVILIFFDAAMLALPTAGASAASAIVYLAHKGNARANWFAICQQFNSFCQHISGSLIGSFVGMVVFISLILLSAVAISKR